VKKGRVFNMCISSPSPSPWVFTDFSTELSTISASVFRGGFPQVPRKPRKLRKSGLPARAKKDPGPGILETQKVPAGFAGFAGFAGLF